MWIYREASTLTGTTNLTVPTGLTTGVQLPQVSTPGKLHVIAQVEDDGNPRLFAYRRVVLDVSPSTPTPTPTATPTPPGTAIQAETAALAGDVSIDTNHPGHNGTGFLNFPLTGGAAQFNDVDAGAGGSTTISFRYANGNAAARTGLLLINGIAQNITFEPTGSWSTWMHHNVTVTLASGTANTIRLESNGADLANIDELIVGGGGAPPLPPPQIPNGTYRMINRGSLKALDVVGNRTADGTAVIQYTYGGGTNQLWVITDVGNNQKTLRSVSSGRYLDVMGSSTDDGAATQILGTTGTSANQRFIFTATDSGYYTVRAVHSGKVLQARGASTANSAVIEQGTNSNGHHQQWTLLAP